MPLTDHQRQLATERKRRYRLRKKIAKYGEASANIDMKGRHRKHARGQRHGRWNNGMATHEDGYLKVKVGVDHPYADPNGYTYLHLLVWLSAGRLAPGPNELIHHKDENKTNNRLDNLELKTRSDHARHHASLRGRDAFGRFPKKREAASA